MPATANAARRSPTRFLPLALVVAAATALFLQTKNFGLLGFDTYPLIASSRVLSLADLLGNFTEGLMQGYYPTFFYRPLVKLTFALDYALWGLEPLGYQWTDIVIFAASALALYALARRLTGAEARMAPWVALLLFLLHPLHYDVVPIPARRAESLCCAFIVLSLFLQLSPRALRARFPLGPALATLGAIAAKETAFVLPAVSFAAVLLYVPCARWGERFARAVTSLVPHAVVVLALLAVRASLGGVGAEALALPGRDEPLLAGSAAARWILLGIAVGLLVGVSTTLFGWAWRARGTPGFPAMRDLRAEVVPLVLILAVLALTFARVNIWSFEYLYLVPVAGWALLCGALSERVVRFARGNGILSYVTALAMILLLSLPVVWQVRFSPLVFHYGEGERATAASSTFLEEARAQIDSAPDGSVVEGPPLPRRVPPADPLRALGTTILLDYSVQAWADLTLPERRVRVLFSREGKPPNLEVAPDEVVLLLTRTLPGF